MGRIDELLQGAVDLHIHSGPGLINRSLDHVEACMEAMNAGMKAIILKDQHSSTANIAPILQKYIVKDSDLKVYGGIPLNNTVGGIDPRVVDCAIAYGAKIVWMPTLSAKNHKEMHEKQSAVAKATMPKANKKLWSDLPLTVLGDDGRLKPEIRDICKMIADADIILASGHISKLETDLLIEEAKAQGVKKIMINHPEHLFGATLDDMRNYAKEGIYMEHSYALYYSNKLTNEYLLEMIKAAGAERTIVSSDLGQPGRPRPVDGYKDFIKSMLELGLSEGEIKAVLCDTPSKLLNLV